MRTDGFAGKRSRCQGDVYRMRSTMAGTGSAKGSAGLGSTHAALIKVIHYRAAGKQMCSDCGMRALPNRVVAALARKRGLAAAGRVVKIERLEFVGCPYSK